MKKFAICTILIVALCFGALSLTSCNSDKGFVKVNEVTHSIFYAPMYVAINEGFFGDEGITIELTNGGGSDKTMTAIVSGDADIGLMGPETAVYVKAQGASNNAVIFGQLTKKDGSFLIGRTAEPDFSWDDLRGTEVIGGRRGGMPAMCLEEATKLAGLDKSTDFILNYDVQFDLITSAFEGGTGDYCTMFEPAASQYEKAGKGYIVASVGAATPEMPYTCFAATKSYIKDNKETVKGFMRAVMRGIDFVITASDEAIVEALRPSFPGVDDDIIAKSVASYKAIDAYMTSPVMSDVAFNNLINLLIEQGTLNKSVAFSDIVDNSIVTELEKEG